MQIEKLQSSIEGLLALVIAESGAQGYAVYEFDEPQGGPVLLSSHGMALAVCADQVVVSFPLLGQSGIVGTLDFSFHNREIITQEIIELLERTAESVAVLIRGSRFGSQLVNLTIRIASLEAELADIKISERARGLAEQSNVDRKSAILRAHITSVLGSRQIEQQLLQHLGILEGRLQERRVLSEAKAVLQRTLQLSEEDAYFRLREASRSTRSRLVDIAQQVRDGNHSLNARRLRLSA